MERKLLFLVSVLVILIISQGKAQVEISMGYASKQFIKFDLSYIVANKMVYGFAIGGALPVRAKGKLYSDIKWNEYPEDVTGYGTDYMLANLMIGKKVNDFIISGILGLNIGIQYQNCHDKLKIFGDNNSDYYVTKSGSFQVNIGGSVKYAVPIKIHPSSHLKFIIGSYVTNIEGLGVTMGLLF